MAMNNLKILAIDDNRDNLTVLQALVLEKFPGTRFSAARNGPAGLALARSENPDVILLDIVMPIMDGFEICQELKKDPVLKMIPVVFLTAGKTDQASRVRALEVGAEGFLKKPIEEAELIAQIRAMTKLKAAQNILYEEKLQLTELVDKSTNALERKAAEYQQTTEALSQSREGHRIIIQTAMDGFYITDLQGRILEVNEAYCRMSGYSEKELLSMRVSDLDVSETPADVADHIKKIMTVGEHRFETRHRRKDGQILEIETGVQYLSGEGGRLVAFMRDVSEAKQAGEKKRRIELQIQQAAKMDAIGRLAAGVGRDFNNALTPLLVISETLLKDLNPGHPMYGDIAEIKKSGERCAFLTRQLLAFSRSQTWEMKPLNLNEILKSMLKMLTRAAGGNIEIINSLDTGLGKILADAGWMEQVISNLTSNAREAMPNGGKLFLETQNVTLDAQYAQSHADVLPGEYVLLTIGDTGGGIDPEILGNIFEPFFTTKAMSIGIGLGLAVVYGIVNRCGGRLSVYSEPGKGSAFKVFLPRVDGKAEDLAEHPLVAVESFRGSETILLVDDEFFLRKEVKRNLEDWGYKILEAGNGRQALEIANSYPEAIQLVITDMVMPGMNGQEMVNQLLALRPQTKTLFVSGYTGNVLVRHGMLHKEANFLLKPYSVETLIAKVRMVLDQA